MTSTDVIPIEITIKSFIHECEVQMLRRMVDPVESSGPSESRRTVLHFLLVQKRADTELSTILFPNANASQDMELIRPCRNGKKFIQAALMSSLSCIREIQVNKGDTQ